MIISSQENKGPPARGNFLGPYSYPRAVLTATSQITVVDGRSRRRRRQNMVTPPPSPPRVDKISCRVRTTVDGRVSSSRPLVASEVEFPTRTPPTRTLPQGASGLYIASRTNGPRNLFRSPPRPFLRLVGSGGGDRYDVACFPAIVSRSSIPPPMAFILFRGPTKKKLWRLVEGPFRSRVSRAARRRGGVDRPSGRKSAVRPKKAPRLSQNMASEVRRARYPPPRIRPLRRRGGTRPFPEPTGVGRGTEGVGAARGIRRDAHDARGFGRLPERTPPFPPRGHPLPPPRPPPPIEHRRNDHHRARHPPVSLSTLRDDDNIPMMTTMAPKHSMVCTHHYMVTVDWAGRGLVCDCAPP